jgi:MFS family permease
MTTQIRNTPAAQPRAGAPSSARWLALAVLCVSLLMVSLDNTVLNVALPTLVRDLTSVLASYHIPHAVLQRILGSLGGALGVAGRVGGVLGAALAQLARSAFISGMDLGLATAACVAAAGCVIALIAVPSRARSHEEGKPDAPGSGSD